MSKDKKTEIMWKFGPHQVFKLEDIIVETATYDSEIVDTRRCND